jgi:3-methyladenine DNA glycosylase AlkD
MNSQELTREIRHYCIQNAHEANVLKYSRYFKEGLYDGYGLTAPQIYAGCKKILELKDLTLASVIEASADIITHGKSEEISIIMLLAKGFHKQFTTETFAAMEKWYHHGINNWAHADTMGMMVLPLFLNKGIVGISDFKSWLTAENKFQRRSVPVTFIKLLKIHPDYTALFSFIECLMTDPEREVHQGTGWFLREAWKRRPEETEAFLMQWKETAPRLIFQYANEKMTAEGKMKFRRSKNRM